MGFDITVLTDGTNGLLKQLKDAVDELSSAVTYRQTELEDSGVNEVYELADHIVNKVTKVTREIEIEQWRLNALQFGQGPTGSLPSGF